MASTDIFANSSYDANAEFFASAETTSASSGDQSSFSNEKSDIFEGNDDMLNEIFCKPATKRMSTIKKSISKKSSDSVDGSETSASSDGKSKPRKRTSKLAALMEPDCDPTEWKRARKRMQNRISAHKCRQRKRHYLETLECKAEQLKNQKSRVERDTHMTLSENLALKEQVRSLENLIRNSADQYLVAQLSHITASAAANTLSHYQSLTAPMPKLARTGSTEIEDWTSSTYSHNQPAEVDFLAVDDVACFNNEALVPDF